jgi:hypothetical protein
LNKGFTKSPFYVIIIIEKREELIMRIGGDSYYVIVNKDGDAYTVDDIIEGEMVLDFDDEDEAEEELQYLLDEGELDEADGWHVERYRW